MNTYKDFEQQMAEVYNNYLIELSEQIITAVYIDQNYQKYQTLGFMQTMYSSEIFTDCNQWYNSYKYKIFEKILMPILETYDKESLTSRHLITRRSYAKMKEILTIINKSIDRKNPDTSQFYAVFNRESSEYIIEGTSNMIMDTCEPFTREASKPVISQKFVIDKLQDWIEKYKKFSQVESFIAFEPTPTTEGKTKLFAGKMYGPCYHIDAHLIKDITEDYIHSINTKKNFKVNK